MSASSAHIWAKIFFSAFSNLIFFQEGGPFLWGHFSGLFKKLLQSGIRLWGEKRTTNSKPLKSLCKTNAFGLRAGWYTDTLIKDFIPYCIVYTVYGQTNNTVLQCLFTNFQPCIHNLLKFSLSYKHGNLSHFNHCIWNEQSEYSPNSRCALLFATAWINPIVPQAFPIVCLMK